KGGITSGILYPPAIEEIRQRFTLAGVGGTSAGAIAAALAAAAELRRRNGSDAGYAELANIPGQIGGAGRLLQLFMPDAETSWLFNAFLRSLRLKEIPGGAKFIDKVPSIIDALRVLLIDSTLRPLGANGLGLCSGMGNGVKPPEGSLPPLTTWLSERIDAIAGKAKDQPLTFGDLWSAPVPDHLKGTMTGRRSIQLQLVSTCLTFGRPYAIPHLDNRFAFSPDEMSRLFPPYVVDHLIREGNQIKPPPHMPSDLLPLPAGEQLPVILGVRMSLCFPVLFSLVPFHYPNFRVDPVRYERAYFADGGITSNLPVHFFDSPFPRWPTLALNLQYTKAPGVFDRSNVDANGVWMTKNAGDGTLELFNRFLLSKSPLGQLGGLAGAIFRSAQTWTDNSFLTLPGFRDRVAEVWLDPHEGGMNLEMPPSVIEGLVKKGRAAGARLVERFADPGGGIAQSWDGHRWTRLRASMSALARYSRAWQESVDHPMPGDRSLWELLAEKNEPCYPFNNETQRREATEAARAFEAFAALLGAASPGRESQESDSKPFHGEPKPRVTLQPRASMT
ncbi:MAG: patatin-like phospholipase family protein, partial [Phycisphaerales bacterium]